MNNRISTKKIALCGVLTALAMIFSYIESVIPIPIPVPGIKLGVANIAVITILYVLGVKEAIVINLLRIALTALLFGNVNSFLFSISGAVLSLTIMIIMKRLDFFSCIGVSVCGGVMHNVGQIIAAVFIMGSEAIVLYLPVLIVSGEFTVTNILDGEKVGYCGSAMFYDEQPTTFKQSWNQRMRWTKGFYQVLFKYGKNLFKTMFKEKRMFVSCYDMIMTLAPATLFTLGTILLNLVLLLCSGFNPVLFKQIFRPTMTAILIGFLNFYLMLLVIGLITLITEWKKILAPGRKKIMYLFSFPLFIATYIPISIVALFKKVEWKPIPHTVVKTIDDLSMTQYKE